MKLRTKIIFISFITILIAILISDAVIWNICRDSLLREEFQAGYSESYQIFQEFQNFVETADIDMDDEEVIQHFFKKRRDDYTVCLKEQENRVSKEYYNHTVFSSDIFEQYEPKEIKNQYSCFEMDWDDHRLLVFVARVKEIFTLYHIVDISEVTRKLVILTALMAGVFVIVIIAAGIILKILLRHALEPLNKLSETSLQIAEGDYHKRVEVNSHDEIGILAENFNIMADAVETSEKRKTLFMGNLTHELKTPLTAISGYAETMLRIQLSEEEQTEALDYIYRECHRLERLSKKMMQLLELDHSEEILPEEFAVQKLFERVKESCDATAKQREVTIRLYDTKETLYADFDLMCDAVINLVDNAVKASKSDSEVWLYTECVDENRFCIVVEDFGRGIFPDEKEQILEPFYMTDKSRSRKNGGAGLGLALTALILRNHKMMLEIESEVSRGTKMKIYNLMKE